MRTTAVPTCGLYLNQSSRLFSKLMNEIEWNRMEIVRRSVSKKGVDSLIWVDDDCEGYAGEVMSIKCLR